MWQKHIIATALAAPCVRAILRFPCSQLVTERLDPLVTPSEVSPHLHQIVGGNAFNITMDPNNDLPSLSTCTTCRFVEDKSNYWTAVMYFKHPNGSYLRVPQMANHNTGPGLQDGGMTIYYFQPPSGRAVAFPKGFRMRVGNPNRRSDDLPPNSIHKVATTMRCFQGVDYGAGAPGYDPTDSYYFPKKMCLGGIRSNIYFPSCWDGKNLDSPDHESHVTYPNGGFFGNSCPASHPVRTPLLFIEIIWDTRPFNDPALWPADGGQPFVFSMGDPTGFGQHADYVFGWEGDSLQRAMDVCTDGNGIADKCTALTVQGMDPMNQCKLPVKVPELVEGTYIDKLPGCNPLQGGPAPATPIASCTAASTLTDVPVSTIPIPIATPPWSVCGRNGPLEPDCDSIPTTLTAEGSKPTPKFTSPPLTIVPPPAWATPAPH